MTKAEQKKQETANKRTFIQKVFLVAMEELCEATREVTGGPKVGMSFTNYNRYIHLNAYGQSTAILIYRNGNVDVKLKEFCHEERVERIFDFTLELTEQEKFLEQFRGMLRWLLPVSFGKCEFDFHSFMDYVEGSESIAVAYESICREWADYGQGK